MARPSLARLIAESTTCVVAPCVYDAASARAVELVGFSAMMFSCGEFSAAGYGLIDRGFANASDVEWMVSRIVQSSPLPLAVDVEDGFGGPLATHRTCKRLARAGASALQLEDGSGHGEDPLALLPIDEYNAKVRAAVAATADTDCMVIARTNADPATQLDDAVRRCAAAHELGAEMTTVVRLSNLDDAAYIAERVPGWKMYPDVSGRDGTAEVTAEQVFELGFQLMTMHYLLKAAMDGMLEHGRHNFARQNALYTADKKDATGVIGESAMALFDPEALMELEAQFTGDRKNFRIGDREIAGLPSQFPRSSGEARF